MQDDTNRKNGRQRAGVRAAGSTEDAARAVGDSIRQAFLTHMSEQQRQFPLAAVAGRRSTERGGNRELAKEIRQQHTGNHGEEAVAGDVRGGTRAGAENVEPKKRRGDS